MGLTPCPSAATRSSSMARSTRGERLLLATAWTLIRSPGALALGSPAEPSTSTLSKSWLERTRHCPPHSITYSAPQEESQTARKPCSVKDRNLEPPHIG